MAENTGNFLEQTNDCAKKLKRLNFIHQNQITQIDQSQIFPDLCSQQCWTIVESGQQAKNTVNTVREAVEFLNNVTPNPSKTKLQFFLGDPSATGFFPTDFTVYSAVQEALLSRRYNGYGPSVGLYEARQAVAQKFSTDEVPIQAEDVIMASGCSHALQMSIEALGSPGDNILVPRPGFPIYETLIKAINVEARHYNLQMDKNWEVDLWHLESLIDCRTKAIVVNNPSNPCGAVYSKPHLQQILKIAEKYHLPIIADEIYGDIVFNGAQFYRLTSLKPKVPILTCDAVSKRYLVPGWRLGWVIVHDPRGVLSGVRCALSQLSAKIVGPCSVIQGALPNILKCTPEWFFEDIRRKLAYNAAFAVAQLKGAPGLMPVRPCGAMYMMVGIFLECFPCFGNEQNFIRALIEEESVYCLPGTVFNFSGSFRIVLIFDVEQTREACKRISAFCKRHYSERVKFGA